MLFFLKKVVSFWLMPLPLSALLLALGCLFLFSDKKKRLGRWLVLLGFVLLAAFSNKAVSRQLAVSLERVYPAIRDEREQTDAERTALARCRYIVILGAGHTDDGDLPYTSRLSESALARMVEGVRIARMLPQATLIASGPAEKGGLPHAKVLAGAAEALGVPSGRLALIDTARDTEDEATRARAIVGNAPIALVTSACHMPRAVALFRRQGIDVLPCPSDYRGQVNAAFRFSDYGWDAESLGRSTAAIHEYLGILWQRLRGVG